MAFIIRDEKSFYDLCDVLACRKSDNWELMQAIDHGDSIELSENHSFILKEPIVIRRSISLLGHGCTLKGDVSEAIIIHSGNVSVEGLVIDKIARSVLVDGLDQEIENIRIANVLINDPGFGVGINIGSSENHGTIRNLCIEDCVINSGYSEEDSLKTGIFDGAMGFNISAACPSSDRQEDLIGALVDGLTIRNCRVLGPRRYGINMLVGITIPQPGTDFMDMKAKIVDCAIRNVRVLDCEFDYCREMGVSLSCGCMNNYGSLLENLEIAGCRVVYGIAGVGFSGAGPIIPTSVSRNMGMRHGSIHDNELIMMDLPVNEPSCTISLCCARSEGFAGVEVYDCFVEDVDIYNNTVINGDMAIQITAANSMGDEAISLSNNHISDVRIFNNHFKDVKTAFTFMAAYAEGRRFDWNWGWRKQDYRFAELSKDHKPTIRFYENFISKIDCHDNDIDGCANEIVAVAALGRGHALMKDNRITDEIYYYNNHFNRSEGHVNVAGAYYSDWVKDEGGNKVCLKEK